MMLRVSQDLGGTSGLRQRETWRFRPRDPGQGSTASEGTLGRDIGVGPSV